MIEDELDNAPDILDAHNGEDLGQTATPRFSVKKIANLVPSNPFSGFGGDENHSVVGEVSVHHGHHKDSHDGYHQNLGWSNANEYLNLNDFDTGTNLSAVSNGNTYVGCGSDKTIVDNQAASSDNQATSSDLYHANPKRYDVFYEPQRFFRAIPISYPVLDKMRGYGHPLFVANDEFTFVRTRLPKFGSITYDCHVAGVVHIEKGSLMKKSVYRMLIGPQEDSFVLAAKKGNSKSWLIATSDSFDESTVVARLNSDEMNEHYSLYEVIDPKAKREPATEGSGSIPMKIGSMLSMSFRGGNSPSSQIAKTNMTLSFVHTHLAKSNLRNIEIDYTNFEDLGVNPKVSLNPDHYNTLTSGSSALVQAAQQANVWSPTAIATIAPRTVGAPPMPEFGQPTSSSGHPSTPRRAASRFLTQHDLRGSFEAVPSGTSDVVGNLLKDRNPVSSNNSVSPDQKSAKFQAFESVCHKTYRNRLPEWNEQLGTYIMNFYGRAKRSNNKNFQIVNDIGNPLLQFCQSFQEDKFNINITAPFNLIQAFAVILSVFDNRRNANSATGVFD